MSLTLAEHRATIRSLGNFASGDTRITDAVVNREINRALRRIALRHDWPWLYAERDYVTVSAQSNYVLPDDFLRSISLRDVDRNYNLSLRGIVEVDEYEGQPGGRPQIYAIHGNILKLAYTPDGTNNLRLRYVTQENVLVNDTDTAKIPDYWIDGLYDAVLAELHRMVKEVDLAGIAEARFQSWIQETQDNIQQSREAPRVRVRPGSFI